MNKKIFYIISAMILVILAQSIFIFYNQKENKNLLKINKQNLVAYNDTIRVLKTKNNKLLYEKSALITDLNSEAKKNKDLQDIVKTLNGKIKYLTSSDIQYLLDTVKITSKDTVFYSVDTVFNCSIPWQYKDNSDSSNLLLKGRTIFDAKYDTNSLKLNNIITSLDTFKINLNVVSGVYKDKQGIYRTFVTSKNSHIKVTNIDSKIDETLFVKKNKKDKIHIGFVLGVGPSINLVGTSPGFNLLSLTGGLGIMYSFY